ncbi:hypothetical protein SteCoe_12232 [Stentor coeruleus]|uniref:RGS domain-containing protein n=1 Tax=Stentor coeruleus TaxID=5963 RepID=A0A1R2CB88_9CILI|nr:hypothetical protein SteCoe_12232 [Stentor coeruleus]
MDAQLYINIGIVTFLVTVFFAIILTVIKKKSSVLTTPIYERSVYLVLLANTANYFEVIFNLILGCVIIESNTNIDIELALSFTGVIYCTRIYASSMALRLYRIQLLHKFRCGEVSRENLMKRSSLLFINILTNSYAFSVSFIETLVVLLVDSDIDIFIIFNSLCYAFEFLVLLGLCLKGIHYTHPTIYIEYIFYCFIWATGISMYYDPIYKRLFFFIPIRNCILLLITIFSLYEHIKVLRPPLPLDLNPEILFEFMELYLDFKDFVMKKGEIKYIKACEIYKNLSKATFMNSFASFDISSSELNLFEDDLKSFLTDAQYDDIRYCMQETLSTVLKEYEASDQYAKFKKQYYMNFN